MFREERLLLHYIVNWGSLLHDLWVCWVVRPASIDTWIDFLDWIGDAQSLSSLFLLLFHTTIPLRKEKEYWKLKFKFHWGEICGSLDTSPNVIHYSDYKGSPCYTAIPDGIQDGQFCRTTTLKVSTRHILHKHTGRLLTPSQEYNSQ